MWGREVSPMVRKETKKEEKKNHIWVKGGDVAQRIYMLRGWWHTFPCHGLTLHLTHYLSKSWSHVPPHIFNVIQYCTTVTLSWVLPLPLLQTRHRTPSQSSA